MQYLKYKYISQYEANFNVDITHVLSYNFIVEQSRKGTKMSVDGRGYIYSKKYDNKTNTTHWRCKYNNPPTKYLAKLKQISAIVVSRTI